MAVHCGHVYCLKLYIAGKDKLLVPAFIEVDGRVRFFVINSERTEFQISRAEVCKHVLPLKQSDNNQVLKHDSWLTCHELIGGWTAAEIEAADGCYRGPLDDETVKSVRALMQESRLHSAADKMAILSQWPKPAEEDSLPQIAEPSVT